MSVGLVLVTGVVFGTLRWEQKSRPLTMAEMRTELMPWCRPSGKGSFLYLPTHRQVAKLFGTGGSAWRAIGVSGLVSCVQQGSVFIAGFFPTAFDENKWLADFESHSFHPTGVAWPEPVFVAKGWVGVLWWVSKDSIMTEGQAVAWISNRFGTPYRYGSFPTVRW